MAARGVRHRTAPLTEMVGVRAYRYLVLARTQLAGVKEWIKGHAAWFAGHCVGNSVGKQIRVSTFNNRNTGGWIDQSIKAAPESFTYSLFATYYVLTAPLVRDAYIGSWLNPRMASRHIPSTSSSLPCDFSPPRHSYHHLHSLAPLVCRFTSLSMRSRIPTSWMIPAI